MLELVDTHCHIQESADKTDDNDATRRLWAKAGHPDPAELVQNSVQAGVKHLICVGCALKDSRQAVELAAAQEAVWASIGIHPHEAKAHLSPEVQDAFAALAGRPKVIAVGECGLDFYYNHSPKDAQIAVLKFQMELALKHNLPMIFHVREAFADFWPIFDSYQGIQGVIHSFTATREDLRQILRRGLFVGLNGIMTFTKNSDQLAAAKAVPLEKLLLETDAPFLTPAPERGKICQPKHVALTAAFLANLRGESLDELTRITTHNARTLFHLR